MENSAVADLAGTNFSFAFKYSHNAWYKISGRPIMRGNEIAAGEAACAHMNNVNNASSVFVSGS